MTDETVFAEWMVSLKVLYRNLFDFFNEMQAQNLDLSGTLQLFDESLRTKLRKLQELQGKLDIARTTLSRQKGGIT